MNKSIANRIFNYNPETGVLKWEIRPGNGFEVGNIAGTQNRNGYRYVMYQGKKYAVHRIAWLMINGQFPPDQIDHINGIRNDNRLINLRAVTRLENLRNQKLRKTNTSKVNGVSWHKKNKTWQVSMQVNNKYICLGSYFDWFDAVCARKAADNLYDFHPNHGAIK